MNQYETEGETLAETEVIINQKRQKLKSCQNFALEFNAIAGCNDHSYALEHTSVLTCDDVRESFKQGLALSLPEEEDVMSRFFEYKGKVKS